MLRKAQNQKTKVSGMPIQALGKSKVNKMSKEEVEGVHNTHKRQKMEEENVVKRR